VVELSRSGIYVFGGNCDQIVGGRHGSMLQKI